MKISLILPTCNGGEEPRLTVQSAQASLAGTDYEIIVVDDNCLDGSTHGMPDDVLVLRTWGRYGASGSRQKGAAVATGDVLIFADSHCRFPEDVLRELAERAAKSDSVIQPCCKISYGSVSRQGGRYRTSARGLQCVLAKSLAKTQTLFGTVYAFNRELYDRLGGWPKLPRTYGGSEQTMSLLCWFAGVQVETQLDLNCIHFARLARELHHTKHYAYSREDYGVNVWVFHKAFFPETLDRDWTKLLNRNFSGIELTPTDTNCLERLREQIAAVTKRSEHEFSPEVFGGNPE